MKMCEKKKLKLNNAGMSLIELLVAIAIISVAILPLLYAFVNVAKTNARAREVQQSTTLAHTVMENCKAYSFGDIEAQMLSGTFLEGVSSAQTDQVGTTFYMTNVPLENQFCDVALEFVPRGINGDTTSSFDIIDTKSMNPYLDAVFTAQGSKCVVDNLTAAECDHNAYLSAFENIAAAIATESGNEVNLSTSYIESSFKDVYDLNYGSFSIERETYIRLYEVSGVERVEVVVRYRYHLNNDKYTYRHVDVDGNVTDYEWSYNEAANENVLEYTFIIYENSDTGDHSAKVENVYLFYYPAYQGALSMYPFLSDYIQISNDLADGNAPDSRQINFYLIKQKNPAYPDSSLQTLESGYEVTVKGYNTGSADPDINLYHNFAENLGGGATTALQSTWFNNITTVNDDYVNTENKVLIYDVDLKIYDAGSYNITTHTLEAGAQPVLTMEGTTLDW